MPARLTPALVIAGLLYSLAAGGLARFSGPAMAAVAVPGVVGVVSAWHAVPGPPAEAAPIQAGRAAGWAAVFVALALWELSAWLRQPTLTSGSPAHPTISFLLAALAEAGTRAGVGSGPGSGGRWVASRG